MKQLFNLDFEEMCAQPGTVDVRDQMIRQALEKGMRPPFEMRWDGPFVYLVEAGRYVDSSQSRPAA